MAFRTFSLVAACWFAVGAALTAQSEPPPRRPHIVFFLADDLGWHDVGYHGSEIRTPAIDRLARTGVRLEQHYAQGVCTPTRASLLTGRYSFRFGLHNGVLRPWDEHGLPRNERTIATALKDVGYRTALVGKWHLGLHRQSQLPRNRGFDHVYGCLNGSCNYYTRKHRKVADWSRNGEQIQEEGYTTDLIGAEAARVVEAHDPTTPLFLFVPFTAPHTPMQAPQDRIDAYAKVKPLRRRIYAAMVTAMDDAIGRVVQMLEKRGMRRDTLIVFCSDNGGWSATGAMNHPFRGEKGGFHEGAVRVATVASWPGEIPENTSISAPLHVCDWFPTFAKLAGCAPSKLPLDGLDAWPMILGRSAPRREFPFSVNPFMGAIRCGDWKLIAHHAVGNRKEPLYELYNVAADPIEVWNLARREPEKFRELRARLKAYESQSTPSVLGKKQPQGFEMPAAWGPRVLDLETASGESPPRRK